MFFPPRESNGNKCLALYYQLRYGIGIKHFSYMKLNEITDYVCILMVSFGLWQMMIYYRL